MAICSVLENHARRFSRSTVHYYRLNGVALGSEVALATLRACDGPADLLLAFPAAIDARARARLYVIAAESGEPFLTVERGDDGYFVRGHGVGDFLVTRGRIDCAPLAACPPAALEQLVVDQIVPRAMQLVGRPCFHASAARIDGVGVVALAGESGAGKSTLSAALAEHGAIVSDDSLALELGDRVMALPGYPSLRLWPEAAEAIAAGARLEPASPRTRKLRLPIRIAEEPAPLVQFFLLDPGGPAGIERLAPREAFAALSRSLHRLAPDDPEAMAAEFRLLGEVSARVPVARVGFAHDFGSLPALVAQLMRWVTR